MTVRVRLFCTDAGCAEIFEAIGRIEELEALACFCGAGLELRGWPEEHAGGRSGEAFELLPVAA
jgi:hypothetical protein